MEINIRNKELIDRKDVSRLVNELKDWVIGRSESKYFNNENTLTDYVCSVIQLSKSVSGKCFNHNIDNKNMTSSPH